MVEDVGKEPMMTVMSSEYIGEDNRDLRTMDCGTAISSGVSTSSGQLQGIITDIG